LKVLLILSFLIFSISSYADITCKVKSVEHARWLITGAHIQEQCTCANCHIEELATGNTPSTCVGCHLDARFFATQVPNMHIPTNTSACDGCHTLNSFLDIKMNHSIVDKQACNTCHNKLYQLDMPNDHVKTTLDCTVCHKSNSWAAKFDHGKAKVAPATCNNCHLSGKNGAILKPNSHFITFDSCDTCHYRGD